jgi:nitrogen regulatory protein PII-like uncharacterized protein
MLVTMKNKGDVPALVRQLEMLNDDLLHRPRQAKQTEKALQFLFDDLCAAYQDATPEQRADISIALEFREKLIGHLLTYYRSITEQALKAARKKRNEPTTLQLIRQSAVANILIGRRVPEEQMEKTNDQVLDAAAAAGFDLGAFVEEMTVSYKVFVQRAIQYHRGKDRIRALKALGIALQEHPPLENNDRVLALASILTGETAMSAVLTLSDRYVLYKFVQELEEAHTLKQTNNELKSRSTIEVIRSWFNN